MIETAAWLSRRQQAYDRLVHEWSAPGLDRSSHAAYTLHQEIVAHIDRLPIEEGGRVMVTRRKEWPDGQGGPLLTRRKELSDGRVPPILTRSTREEV